MGFARTGTWALRDRDEPRRIIAHPVGCSPTRYYTATYLVGRGTEVEPSLPQITTGVMTYRTGSDSRRAVPARPSRAARTPTSSSSSRSAASTADSPGSTRPPGNAHCSACELSRDARRHRRKAHHRKRRPCGRRGTSGIGRPSIQSSTGAGSTLSSPTSESTRTTATAACFFVGSVTDAIGRGPPGAFGFGRAAPRRR